MELSQLGAGFDPKLIHHPVADHPERVQGVGLSP
jgi:hypothetical protein